MATENKGAQPAACIRDLLQADVPAVIRIVQESPEAADWTPESFERFIFKTGAVALVSETYGKVSGFVVAWQVGDEAEVLNLAVRHECRCQGHGGALLEAGLKKLRLAGVVRIFLEVRESNSLAISFYEKHGFSKMGHRPGYYKDPAEGAVLMERKFTA